MIIENPERFDGRCYAVVDREMLVRSDGEALNFDELLQIREACGGAERLDLFAEPEMGIAVLALSQEAMAKMTVQEMGGVYTRKLIRMHFDENDADEVNRTARAKALVGWRASTKYCGRCGTRLQNHETMTACVCPECGQLVFPRIEPCVITVVSRPDGKILLARHVQRNQNIYACIAGFMEAGETAEQAVAREVMEETGLKVKNIRYYGSQSWPFPSQLMLGFTAEYDGGEIHLQAEELSDAQWFDRDNCPASPPPGSIAYQLIHNSR